MQRVAHLQRLSTCAKRTTCQRQPTTQGQLGQYHPHSFISITPRSLAVTSNVHTTIPTPYHSPSHSRSFASQSSTNTNAMNVFDRSQTHERGTTQENDSRATYKHLFSQDRILTILFVPSMCGYLSVLLCGLAEMKLAQRRQAALNPNYAFYHYLRDEIASRLVDRLADINKAFPLVVEFGCGSGAHVSKLLKPLSAPSSAALAAMAEAAANPSTAASSLPPTSVANRGVIKTLHLCDSSPEALERTRQYWTEHASDIPSDREQIYQVVDEEGPLPFGPGSVDLIISNMSMHWINDLPGFLKRCRAILKPDGVFLAAMLGGSTLQELRSAFTVADMERLGGVNAHVSPFAYGRDCGDLMAAAGFNMPTIDTDVLTVRYPDLFTLSDHLQGMGENGCIHQRPASVSRDVFISAAATYEALYADEENLLPATFQVFYMIGWAPHVSQPKPLERGTATAKLTELNKIAQQQDATAQVQGDAGASFTFNTSDKPTTLA